MIDGNDDDLSYVSKVINAIRQGGYNISAQDIEYSENAKHIGDPTQVDDAYGDTTNSSTQEQLKNIFHDIERGEFWNKANDVQTTSELVKLLMAA